MAAPVQPTISAPAFVDNALPHGARYELFNSGTIAAGVAQAWYPCETITPARPSKEIRRPNPIGGPNGFVLVGDQETMTVKAQIPSTNSPTIKRGWWFSDDFDPSTGTFVPGQPETAPGAVEYWVVSSATDTYQEGSYLYQNLTLLKAYFPAVD